jgi:hypothetical protein
MVKGPKYRKNEGLKSRRGARRGCGLTFWGSRQNQWENLKPIDNWNDGQMQSLRRDCGARRGAKLTGMRTAWSGIQIGTKVELSRQEDNSEQQSADTQLLRVAEHPHT